ncbi:hypothetical protein [Isoptericola croceus]|uniref:hypothetical protein n=1 Tax=Isoptericola croceus TaxID=3031406 RepID=UPI0023F7C887|nr:hypothetical protein [Isoptericola croceus]
MSALNHVIPTSPWPDLLAALSEAGTPVHVVTGDRPDVGTTPEHRRMLATHGARVAVVEGAALLRASRRARGVPAGHDGVPRRRSGAYAEGLTSIPHG